MAVGVDAQIRRYQSFLEDMAGGGAFDSPESIAAQRLLCGRILTFLAQVAQPFHRETLTGHVTGSALVVNSDFTHICLMHHAKLGTWVQPGGHSDGDPNTADVALREVCEETGLACVSVVRPDFSSQHATPFPVDLDVHTIPARGDVPAHLHYDLRYLVVAKSTGDLDGTSSLPELMRNDESIALAWFELKDGRALAELRVDLSVLRLARKAQSLHRMRAPGQDL